MLPEVAELGHLGARDVVRHRHARQLDDAALDRVHQREVAHRPREQRALAVPRSRQEERRRRQVDHLRNTDAALHRLQPGDPQPRRLVVLLGLLLVVALERVGRLLGVIQAGAVAVVRLVVDDHDVVQALQLRHHPVDHLPLGLQRVQRRTAAPLQQQAPALGQLQPLAPLEDVVVRDNDARLAQVGQQVIGHQLPGLVIVVRVARQQHAQPLLDRQPRRDEQETVREALAVPEPDGVERLPGDQHRHHRRLARPGRQLQRQSHQARIGRIAGRFKVVEETPDRCAAPGCHLGEPDHRLGRLDLAEERARAAEVVIAPVPQQPLGDGTDTPVGRILQRPPLVHLGAQAIEQRDIGIGLLLR